MPKALYETMVLLDLTKISTDTEVAKNAVNHTIEKLGGEILVARPWDESGKLSYPISKQKKAYFYILYYWFESTRQQELEQDFRISENILRYLTSAIDPKWAETILDIARGEHNHRFAYKAMRDDSTQIGEGIVSNDPLVRGAGDANGEAPAPAPRPRGRRSAEASADKPE
jgi:small subunit ribosomal protein S6